jgi:phosphatidylserine decarboxylase
VTDAGWRAALVVLRRLPQATMSRAFGRLADLPIPRPARRAVLGAFARALGIDLSEVARPLGDYPSLDAFFTRQLREGTRRWPPENRVFGSPVDGIAGESGRIEAGRLVQAKGIRYSVAELLDDEAQAARFQGGAFATFYLSPRHYHRIHTPCRGVIAEAHHVPGALLPVNPPSVRSVPGLFARNERLICFVDGLAGRVAVAAVGAFNVGRISAAFDPGWTTNRRGAGPERRTYEPPVPVAAGQEIMTFHLGSTVVLLFGPGVELRSTVVGAEVRLGDAVARSTIDDR